MTDDLAAARRRSLAEGLPLVAYQGVAGAFGETAIHRVWGNNARPHPTPTFAAALDAVCRGRASYAVLPHWNSSTGPVLQARRALDEYRLRVSRVSEVVVPVSLCLIARPGTSMSDVRYVGSHPTALAQCRQLFADFPRLVECEAFNTAGAVRDLACLDGVSPTGARWYTRLAFASSAELAAIASERAAEQYGLTVLRDRVNDDPKNRTRFLVLRSREDTLAG